MSRKIFVNLPVADLARSMAFFRALGFSFNAQFTDETAACMVVSEDIYVMLLSRAKFAGFTGKPVADAHATTEVLVALSMDSKAEVVALTDAAVAAGATEAKPLNDMGFMAIRSFNDLDGHIWEIFWMDPSHVQAG